MTTKYCTRRSMLMAAVALCPLPSHAGSTRLRSPWDVRPWFAGETVSGCPQNLRLPITIGAKDFYSDPSHSVIDPGRKQAYDEAVRPIRSAVRKVVALADVFRQTGSPSAASCVGRLLAGFAGSAALTEAGSSNQSVYVQGWMLGALAISHLKVRPSGTLDLERDGLIQAWLARLAEQQIAYYTPRSEKVDGRNNHRYWAGLAVMAAGVASSRADLLHWGTQSIRIGLAQITPEGTLPLELERKRLALHYHLFAAAALVTAAELAMPNGINLYAERDGALTRLVRRALAGINDPSFFTAASGIDQQRARDRADLAWLAPYAERWQDPAADKVLRGISSRSFLYIGGEPPPVTSHEGDAL